jgi:hypothetical protein
MDRHSKFLGALTGNGFLNFYMSINNILVVCPNLRTFRWYTSEKYNKKKKEKF